MVAGEGRRGVVSGSDVVDDEKDASFIPVCVLS